MIDVSHQMGINVNEQTTSVVAADFNNDGWTDLFFMRYGNMAKTTTQYLYINNSGESFSLMPDHGVVSTNLGSTGAGAEVIDYDKDGDLDLVIANERGTWQLFENNSNLLQENNYIGLAIGKSPSGKTSHLGATITITACGRQQKKIIGSTASSYAVNYNNDVVFGLGKCSEVEKISARWTNGETKQMTNAAINQYINL